MLGVPNFGPPPDVNVFYKPIIPPGFIIILPFGYFIIQSSRKSKSENPNMPVKDCYVKIAGNYIQGENNQIVMTNDQGDYDIQVPIGRHNISA